MIATLQATDRVVLLDFSDSSLPKEIATSTFASEITQFLRLDQLTLEAQIVATDNFVFSDTSNSNAIRRVTWGGAIARMADQDTIITANAIMRINDGGVDTNEVADEAVTEPKLDISNVPVDDYVIAWDGPNSTMVWRAEGSPPPPLTHTRYFATGARPDVCRGRLHRRIVVHQPTRSPLPAFTINSYFAIAVPASNPITSIIAAWSPILNRI